MTDFKNWIAMESRFEPPIDELGYLLPYKL